LFNHKQLKERIH